MASSSPATSNNNTATPSLIGATASTTTNTTTVANANSSKNLRGLNKPKCIKCGNVARSRCPYQSCKSCCAKAQNPCHIHVLKANATFPDKITSSSSPSFDQQSKEASPSGTSHRFTSLRQLSSNFAQFNNLQSPNRSRKPLTRKEAAVLNEWRFSKLKEYGDRNIELENEAFGRYMQNVNLLEEVLAVSSTLEEHNNDLNANSASTEDSNAMSVARLKLKRRSNPVRSEQITKRLREIVDQGLRKLWKSDPKDGGDNPGKQDKLARNQEKENEKTGRAERASVLTDLLDKLNKARNEEDLKSCLEMKLQLFNKHRKTSQPETEDIEISNRDTAKNELLSRLKADYSPPKWFSSVDVDQEALNRVNVHFSSLKEKGTL